MQSLAEIQKELGVVSDNNDEMETVENIYWALKRMYESDELTVGEKRELTATVIDGAKAFLAEQRRAPSTS